MRQVYDVGIASKSVARPWFSPPPYKSWLIGMRKPDAEEPRVLYGFFDAAGACLGTTLLFVPSQDNLEKVYADLDVAPQHRRQGIGAALVRDAIAQVRELGRTTLLVETLAPGDDDQEEHEYARFARAHGFSPAWRELAQHLALPVADEVLARIVADAAAHSAGYRVETFVGRVPDHLLPGLAELMGLLAADAPSGEVEFEGEVVTPERLRRMYEREAEQGRIRLSCVAIEESTGVVAAQTDLVFDASLDPVVQEGTYVHRQHRGHRLGSAVKAANLQRLQRDHPGRPLVRTMNADTNEHMVAINAELGFEVVETSTEWVIELANR